MNLKCRWTPNRKYTNNKNSFLSVFLHGVSVNKLKLESYLFWTFELKFNQTNVFKSLLGLESFQRCTVGVVDNTVLISFLFGSSTCVTWSIEWACSTPKCSSNYWILWAFFFLRLAIKYVCVCYAWKREFWNGSKLRTIDNNGLFFLLSPLTHYTLTDDVRRSMAAYWARKCMFNWQTANKYSFRGVIYSQYRFLLSPYYVWMPEQIIRCVCARLEIGLFKRTVDVGSQKSILLL